MGLSVCDKNKMWHGGGGGVELVKESSILRDVIYECPLIPQYKI